MINQKESNAISILRVMAMFSIVTCHILQGLDNRWAWILNVGVQMFFVMSGYLYGNKQIEDWKKWYTKRIRKLYIPFILFASFGLIAYGLFTDTNVGIKNICAYIFNIQGFAGSVRGLSHLWFMTAIALSYIQTPFLQFFRKYGNWALTCLLVIGIIQYGFIQYQLFKFSWFYLYAVGYFYVLADKKIKITFLTCTSLGLIYMLSEFNWDLIKDYHDWYTRLLHDILGFELFIAGMALLVFCNFKASSYITTLDHLSFPIYITHQVFILGPFSLLGRVNSYVDILLIIGATITSALLLNAVSKKILEVL